MGMFRGRGRQGAEAAPAPIRRDRVMGLLQAYMAESDADPDGDGAESAALGELARNSTPAEYGAMLEAARRNGY